MWIRKYDFNYGRRKMMESVAYGLGAGVLMPLDKLIAAEQDISKAYPDELMSIEMYTKGRIKPGDVVTTDMWQDRNIVSFRCSVRARKSIVLDCGRCTLGG